MQVDRLEVFSPVGLERLKPASAASRLSDLDGKTICEIWNGLYKGDEVFPVVRELLARKYPNVKVIPFTEFSLLYGGDTPAQQNESAKRIAVLAKEKGCDALISGNGA